MHGQGEFDMIDDEIDEKVGILQKGIE